MKILELFTEYLDMKVQELASPDSWLAAVKAFERYGRNPTVASLLLRDDPSKNKDAIDKARWLWGGWHKFLVRYGVKPSSQRTYTGHLRSALNDYEQRYGVRLAYYQPKNKRTPHQVVVLPPSLVRKFMEWEPKGLNMEEEAVLFLAKFQLRTLLRLSDALRVRPNMLVNLGDGRYSFTIMNKKTGQQTIHVIPAWMAQRVRSGLLPPRWRRYRRKNTILERYNRLLKELLRSWVPAHRPIKVMQQRPDGRVEYVDRLLPDVITSHKFRASGITYQMEAGVPEPQVKTQSGHSPNSKTFRANYYGFSAQDFLDNQKNLY